MIDWIIAQQIFTPTTPTFHCRQSITPSPTDVGLGHVTCFAQRNISLHDAQRLHVLVWPGLIFMLQGFSPGSLFPFPQPEEGQTDMQYIEPNSEPSTEPSQPAIHSSATQLHSLPWLL